jgi:putative exporter of polyketide antibiotics
VPARLLRFAILLALFGLVVTMIHLIWPSPLMFTIFMLFGQSSFAAAMVIYGFVILRDLKHRKAL